MVRSTRFVVARPGAVAGLVKSRVQRTAPINQRVRSLALGIEPAPAATTLSALLADAGFDVATGGHAVYLRPQPRLTEQLGIDLSIYPDAVGLKILKNVGEPETTGYLTSTTDSTARRSLIGSTAQQVVAANVLADLDLGPRVHDLVRLDVGGEIHPAFVVEHVDGTEPTEAEQSAFLTQIEALLDDQILDIALPDWRTHDDFAGDGLLANLVMAAGHARYVDFQNFFVPDPAEHVARLVAGTTETLHFGDSRTRSSSLLYQAIPGTKHRSKRDTSKRFDLIRTRLDDLGLTLSDRLVLDVGSNSGMMMHAALGEGARWALGWDRPALAEASARILQALGSTRFEITGTELDASYPLADDVPERLRPFLDEAIVFYLAVHQHIGSNQSLAEMPWRAMVFEGHQDDSDAQFESAMAPFLRDAQVADRFWVQDSDSAPRQCALLVRE